MELQGSWQKGESQNILICDAIWENLSDVAKQHFEKWLELVLKLVYNSVELLNII